MKTDEPNNKVWQQRRLRIDNVSDLKQEIRLMEMERLQREHELKQEFDEIINGLKPSSLIKKAIPAGVSLFQHSGKKIAGGMLGLIVTTALKKFLSRRKKKE